MSSIELLVFCFIVIITLLGLFFVIRFSTKTNKKVELLETLVDQQDYQILLLRKLLAVSGVNLDNEDFDSDLTAREPTDAKQPAVSPQIKKELEDLGVNEIFPER